MIMSEAELFILKQQASVLKELKQRYEGKTLDNVLQQLESRIAFYATGATTASRTKSPTSARWWASNWNKTSKKS